MLDYERSTTTRETNMTTPTTDPAATQPAATVSRSDTTYKASGPGGATLASRIVMFVFGILQVLLILRIILLALVANQSNDVVNLIMTLTDPFVEPFRGMFALDKVTAGQGSVFDVAALVALIGWTLVEALILAGIRIFSRRPSETV
jgi:uncharacterized protein YggT (Ycf19 family)